jgi:hypothetical protein
MSAAGMRKKSGARLAMRVRDTKIAKGTAAVADFPARRTTILRSGREPASVETLASGAPGFVAGVYGTVNIQPGIGSLSGDAGLLRTKRPLSFAPA